MDERDLNKTTVPLGKSETHNPPFQKDTHCVNVLNDVWNVLNFEIMNLLKEQNEELSKKLEKLERAFEILKDKGVCVRNDRLFFDYEIYIKSTKEERELLKEVLGNENT